MRDQLVQAVARICPPPLGWNAEPLVERAMADLPHEPSPDPHARSAKAHRALVIALGGLRAGLHPSPSAPAEPRRLLEALTALPPPTRRPATLYLLGHPMPAIAQRLRLPLDEAERRAHQGLAHLRHRVWERDDAELDDLPQLRRLFIHPALSRRPTRDCPDPSALYVAVHEAMPPNALGPLLDHLAGCARCVESWRLAEAIELRDQSAEVIPLFPTGAPPDPGAPEAGAPDPDAPRPGVRSPPPWRNPLLWRIALGVLGVAAVVALAVLPTYSRQIPPAPLQATGPALHDTTHYDGGALRLTWTGAPPGTVFHGELLDGTGKRLFTTPPLSAPQWVLSEAELAQLEAEGPVYWRVWGRTPDGLRVRSPQWPLPVEP